MKTHWMDVKHWIYAMLSGGFIVLRSLGAGKYALNSLMLKIFFFCVLISPCYREDLSVCGSLLFHVLRK